MSFLMKIHYGYFYKKILKISAMDFLIFKVLQPGFLFFAQFEAETGNFLNFGGFQPQQFLKNFLNFREFQPRVSYKGFLINKLECTALFQERNSKN